jgi:archaellin
MRKYLPIVLGALLISATAAPFVSAQLECEGISGHIAQDGTVDKILIYLSTESDPISIKEVILSIATNEGEYIYLFNPAYFIPQPPSNLFRSSGWPENDDAKKNFGLTVIEDADGSLSQEGLPTLTPDDRCALMLSTCGRLGKVSEKKTIKLAIHYCDHPPRVLEFVVHGRRGGTAQLY